MLTAQALTTRRAKHLLRTGGAELISPSQLKIALLNEVLTLFAIAQPPNPPLANLMALPHEQGNEAKRDELQECHHAVCPAEGHERYPLVDVEGDREAKAEAEGVQHDRRLRGVLCKDLARVAMRSWVSTVACLMSEIQVQMSGTAYLTVTGVMVSEPKVTRI